MTQDNLADRRIALVRAHMAAEIAHDFDAAIKTFARPLYELVGAGETFDGEAAVRDYYRRTREAFPDQRNEIISIRAAENAVIVEFWLLGTHLGPLQTPMGEMAPTGKAFREKMCAIFEFEDSLIVAERIYFDRMSIMRQLAVR